MNRSDSIGTRIQKLRDDIGLTQAELADKIGVRRETVNQWESNTRDLKPDKTVKLAQFFEVTCDFILTGIRSDSVDTSRKTGLTQVVIDQLEGINSIASHKREQFLRIINGILSNKAFYSHILKHTANAITIHDGDTLNGQGGHTDIPDEMRQKFEEAVNMVKFANQTGYTDYIILSCDAARDNQIQYATDAFRAILQHIIEGGYQWPV
jgi:transcriptional regulator with XRE-family HTH domain